jgi:hypothetical protein
MELEKLQELIQTTASLVVGDFDLETLGVETAVAVPFFDGRDDQSDKDIEELNKRTLIEIADETQADFASIGKQDFASIGKQDDQYFTCSFLNCKDAFMDEECKECISELMLQDMHFCKNHSIHDDHKHALLPPIACSKTTIDDKITESEEGTKANHVRIRKQDDQYFTCSFLNCKDAFMDEECKECISELMLQDMHFCANHRLHADHKLTLLPPIAYSKTTIDDKITESEEEGTKANHVRIRKQDDQYFTCSFLNCKDAFMDEECKECIADFNRPAMHFCKNHSLHTDHKSKFLTNSKDKYELTIADRNMLNTFSAATEYKAFVIAEDSEEDNFVADSKEAASQPKLSIKVVENQDNKNLQQDEDSEEENNINTTTGDQYVHVYNLLKSIREVFVFNFYHFF